MAVPDVELRGCAACYYHNARQQTVCNSFALIQALLAANHDDMQVVNMSLAGPDDRLIKKIISKMVDNGTIFVAADNPGNHALRFPASMEQVIAVSVLSDNRILQPALIRTQDEHLSTKTGGEYQFYYGSSMSAARVSALVSLLLEKFPDLNARQSHDLLIGASTDCPSNRGVENLCLMSFALGRPMQHFSSKEVSL